MKILSAGPTSISKEVMAEMGKIHTNPDLDPNYTQFHRNVEKKIAKILNTEQTTFLMLGEAIMGLEAAVINIVNRGDRVLVLHNGYFGKGFSEYVENVGATPVELKFDYRRGIDIEKLREYLEKDSDFKAATFVHCETPFGITNDIEKIGKLLNSYNILSIVDSVSGIGGEYIDFDEFKLDVLIGGSQKVLSAPTGLTTITLSERAKDEIAKKKVASYYLNFKNFYDYKDAAFAFPYTMNENLVHAMDVAVDKVLSRDTVALHRKYAEATRIAVEKAGLELYAKDYFANTVTTVLLPEGFDALKLLEKMRERGIIISGGMADILHSAFRIGHMGNNIDFDDFKEMFRNLDEVLKEMKVPMKGSLEEEFVKAIEK